MSTREDAESTPEQTSREQSCGPAAGAPGMASGADEADLVEEELLVEEVSIDGMCGVY